MARQGLNLKKRRRVAEIIGMDVIEAHVNSVWGKGWVEAWVTPHDSMLVHLKTRIFTQLTMNGKAIEVKPLWRRKGCCA